MSLFLDPSIMPPYLEQYFGDGARGESRRAGAGRHVMSGYIEIIRFFGDLAIDPSGVALRHVNLPYRFADDRIERFARSRSDELRRMGRLHDGPPVAACMNLSLANGQFFCQVQPCIYDDQAGTCFALDYPDELLGNPPTTLREFTIMTAPSLAYHQLPYPVCFGACGFVAASDRRGNPFLLEVRRGRRLASLEGTLGPSVAGAVEYYPADTSLLEMLVRTIRHESSEELFLEPSEYRLVPLGYARELFRGGRPQLFCLLEVILDPELLRERLHAHVQDGHEFDQFRWVAVREGRLDDRTVARFNPEAELAYLLAEEYWAASRR